LTVIVYFSSVSSQIVAMGRYCADCELYLSNSQFSSNQWRKGDGNSRCRDCVDGSTKYGCGECGRSFQTQNELNMHMQVHRPRDVACPICGERRFRSGANAVQHVESGYCSGCRGRDNARQEIYRYASGKSVMQPYMSGTPLLTDGSGTTIVPDFPYHYPDCAKSFRNLSQLLQHQDQKHRNYRTLGY